MYPNVPDRARPLAGPVRAIVKAAKRRATTVLPKADTSGPWAMRAVSSGGHLPDGTVFRVIVIVRGPDCRMPLPYADAFPAAAGQAERLRERVDAARRVLAQASPAVVGAMSRACLAHAHGRLHGALVQLLDDVAGLLDDGEVTR